MFKIFKAMRQADHIHLRCPEYRFVGLCFTDFFQVKKTANMLEIGIKVKITLDTNSKKKY
jgi:hypothetical protein